MVNPTPQVEVDDVKAVAGLADGDKEREAQEMSDWMMAGQSQDGQRKEWRDQAVMHQKKRDFLALHHHSKNTAQSNDRQPEACTVGQLQPIVQM